jgi:hypothetical protein
MQLRAHRSNNNHALQALLSDIRPRALGLLRTTGLLVSNAVIILSVFPVTVPVLGLRKVNTHSGQLSSCVPSENVELEPLLSAKHTPLNDLLGWKPAKETN